jgi:type IV pilus assembly protein PilO
MSAKELAIPKSGSLFLEKLEKLVLWQRVAILAGLIVLMVGATVWLLLLPQYEEIGKLDEKSQGLEKKLATAKLNAAELVKFQAKMQEAEAQFKIAMRALPENQEIPSLLTSISKSGQEVGLEFLLFEPKPETRREFYAEIPVAMSLRGDYHNLAVFFDKVARLSRIVNINNISVTPIGATPGKGGVATPGKDGQGLNTLCTAVTYKFVEPLPEKAAAPAKPAPAAPAKPGGGQPKKNTKTDF